MSGQTMQSDIRDLTSGIPQAVTMGFGATVEPRPARWMPTEDERRRRPRIPFDGKVRLGPVGQATRSELPAENLSAEGIFLRCAQPVKVGARFSMELELPNGERVFVPEAEVLYNRANKGPRPSGFGARFVNAPAAAVEKLKRATTAWSGTEVPRKVVQRGGSAAPAHAESLLLYAESRVPDPVTDEAIVTDPCRVPVELAASMQIEIASMSPQRIGTAPAVNDLICPPTEKVDTESNEALDAPEVVEAAELAEPVDDEQEPSTQPELIVELHASKIQHVPAELAPDAELIKALEDEPLSLRPALEALGNQGRPPELVGKHDVHAALSRRPGDGSARPSRRPSASQLKMRSQRASFIEAPPSLVPQEAIEIPEPAVELPPSRMQLAAAATKSFFLDVGRYMKSHKVIVLMTAVVSASATWIATEPAAAVVVEPIAAPVEAPQTPTEAIVVAPTEATMIPAPLVTPAVAPVSPSAKVESGVELALPKDAKVLRTLRLSNPSRFVVDIDAQPGTVSSKRSSGKVLGVRVGRHDGFTRVVVDMEGQMRQPTVTTSDGIMNIKL